MNISSKIIAIAIAISATGIASNIVQAQTEIELLESRIVWNLCTNMN